MIKKLRREYDHCFRRQCISGHRPANRTRRLKLPMSVKSLPHCYLTSLLLPLTSLLLLLTQILINKSKNALIDNYDVLMVSVISCRKLYSSGK